MVNRKHCSFCGNFDGADCDCTADGPRIASLPADLDDDFGADDTEDRFQSGDWPDSSEEIIDGVDHPMADGLNDDGTPRWWNDAARESSCPPCPTCGSTETICDCEVNDNGELIVPGPPEEEPEI
jgi:hypothetical protein